MDSLIEFENRNKVLEGTGSMVLDRVNKICYACRSHRTDDKVLETYKHARNVDRAQIEFLKRRLLRAQGMQTPGWSSIYQDPHR